MTMSTPSLTVFAASGVELRTDAVRRAKQGLQALGFAVNIDPSVKARHQRFAGTDDRRLETLHRVATGAPSVALAVRGGYGLTRLLDRIDWPLLGRSVEQGTRWVGYSDLTALQLALWAHTKQGSWHGPMAADDFGAADPADADEQEQREITRECFREAMSGELEAVGFRTGPGFDGLERSGRLWGGNLAMVCSLLGTRHWPKLNRGILFLEDVGEHPYRVERMLWQLHQAGVLQSQQAVVLGAFTAFRPSPLDRGYGLKDTVNALRAVCDTPILTGLPFGHQALKVCLPVGRRTRLWVQGRDALLAWG